jgi:hypothetical protein
MLFKTAPATSEIVSFFRPPDFCQGQHEKQVMTLDIQWAEDQDAVTLQSDDRPLGGDQGPVSNQKDPWGPRA